VRRGLHIVRALAIAGAMALAACAPKEGPGLKVTVDLGNFVGQVQTMNVVIGADPDGFKSYMGPNVSHVGVRTEDVDGNGTLELVVQFVQPDATTSFRVATGNQATLTMSAHAMGFGTDDLIADATDSTSLSPGGEASVALHMAAASVGPIGAHTRTTDLGTATTDVTVLGAQAGSNIGALAVCDVDGDGAQDIIIGAPGDMIAGGSVGATGAVHIVWGGWPRNATVDLAQPDQPNADTHFYGTESAAQLGTAVACVDLDGDTYDDIIVGSPGADNGKGRIYVVFGRPNFRSSRPVDLTSPTTGAEIVWTTSSSPTAALGSVLFASARRPGIAPFILASELGTKTTHLLTDVRPATTGPKQLDASAADHPTFTGAVGWSLGAGDLDGDATTSNKLDVAIGDINYREATDMGMRRGRVYLFSNVDPAGTAPIDVATANTTITGKDKNSQLGTALLIADTLNQGEDLFVGAPADDTNGVVYLVAHSEYFFLSPTIQTGDTQAISGYEPGGFYGAALASTRAGSTSATGLRLAVGAPGVSRPGRIGVGAAYLYKAGADHMFRIYDQVYGKDAGDALGAAVAGGQLNSPATGQMNPDEIGDLVAAAPSAAGSVPGTGVVYVRFGQ